MGFVFQQRAARQVGRRANVLRQRRCRHRNDGFRHQPFHLQAGIVARAKANGQVHVFQLKVHQALGGQQAQLDARMALLERFQAGNQPTRGKSRGRGHHERVAGALLAHFRNRALDLVEGIGHQGPKFAGRIAQGQPAPAPEQGHAQIVFQGLDVLADRPRRDVQLFRGAHEGLVACGRFERAQRIQGREASWHEFF